MSSPKPPRSSLSVRDMAAAVGVLVVLALLVAGVGRACSFAPGGPQVDPGAVPVVDAPAQLARAARDVPFPVRVPAVPSGWHANSSGVDPVGGAGRAVRVGYLTAEHRFVRLLQSDVPEEALLRTVTGPAAVPGQRPVDVGGTPWVVYGGQADEPIWIADSGGVRYLITGSASEADFRALAAAVLAGPVAPR